jgi:hypothetical protein
MTEADYLNRMTTNCEAWLEARVRGKLDACQIIHVRWRELDNSRRKLERKNRR